jgi:YfiH family protein
VTTHPGAVCVVMTADCLPILLCDDQGTVVGAAHAGWRGLCDGVIEASVSAMQVPAPRLMAWLGPAIGPGEFEVGDEVRAAFITKQPQAAAAFIAGENGKWLANLYQLARLRLHALGINRVYGGELCTYSDPERYYSYRRDGVTGRMGTFIWLS